MVRLILFIHMAVLAFVTTGCFWPWTTTLIIHAAFVPLMILHWRTNRNRCFLSQLEERFRAPSRGVGEKVDAEESQFVRNLWKKIFGKTPSPKVLERTIYGIITCVWVISAGRLTLRLAS